MPNPVSKFSFLESPLPYLFRTISSDSHMFSAARCKELVLYFKVIGDNFFKKNGEVAFGLSNMRG